MQVAGCMLQLFMMSCLNRPTRIMASEDGLAALIPCSANTKAVMVAPQTACKTACRVALDKREYGEWLADSLNRPLVWVPDGFGDVDCCSGRCRTWRRGSPTGRQVIGDGDGDIRSSLWRRAPCCVRMGVCFGTMAKVKRRKGEARRVKTGEMTQLQARSTRSCSNAHCVRYKTTSTPARKHDVTSFDFARLSVTTENN